MTTQPKFDKFKITDIDGDSVEVWGKTQNCAPMLTARGTRGIISIWIPPEEAPALAQAILDAAGARPFTDPEPEPVLPKVEKVGGCYYVDRVHVSCGEAEDATVEEIQESIQEKDRELVVLKFQLGEREVEAKHAAADLTAHRDRVAGDIYAIPYDRLLPNPRRAVDRIVELEDAK